MTTFALQPLGIGVEGIVSLAARIVLKSSVFPPTWQLRMVFLKKCTSYIWVVAWYSFSMSFYTRSVMGAGFMISTANMPRGWTVKAFRFVARGYLGGPGEI